MGPRPRVEGSCYIPSMRRVGGVVVALAVLGSGCRGPASVEPSTPVHAVPAAGGESVSRGEVDPPDGSGATADSPTVVDSARPATPNGATSPVPEPPHLQAVVPVTVPFAPGAVVVQAVEDHPPVVLFTDETAPIRRRVARFLAARGHAVVPIEQLERIEATAAQGQLVLEGDQTCMAPLSRAEVLARYFPRSPRVTVEAMCDERCALQLMLEVPDREDAIEFYGSPNVDRPHQPRAWLWAAGRLRETDIIFGIGGGMIGSSHPPPIMFGMPDSIGPWSPKPDGERLGALEGKVAGCAHPDPQVGLTYEVRAAVGQSGAVTRCTATTEHPMARPADAECLCRGIQTLRYPAGRPGRRLRVQAVDTGGFSSSEVELEPLQAGTEAWVTRLRESTALSRCLSKHRVDGPLESTLVLGLATDGAVQDARIFGDITTMPAMQLAQCLVQELRTVPLPCRPPGVEQLQVRVALKKR